MLDGSIRLEQLGRLLAWYVGVTRGWQTELGAHGRWLRRALDEPTWQAYLATFSDSSVPGSWSALLATMELAGTVGRAVGARLGYEYPSEVDRQVSDYIRSLAPEDR